MVWDKTEPTNSTKLRNLGIVIRPNWLAIEEADSSFQPDAMILTDRTPLGVSNDPTAAVSGGTSRGNGYTLYCKQDSSGDQQLYGIDPSSNIIQFTSGAPTLAATGRVFLPGGILMQWNTGPASSGGTVTFPVAFSSTPYYVNFTVTGSSGTNRIFTRLSGAPTSTSFSPIILNNSGGGLTETIYYIAIGPQ